MDVRGRGWEGKGEEEGLGGDVAAGSHLQASGFSERGLKSEARGSKRLEGPAANQKAHQRLDLAHRHRSLPAGSDSHRMCGHPRPRDKDDDETLGEK